MWCGVGVDIPAVIHNLPSWVSSFDYNLASQMFIQRPSAAGLTAHLDTLSVQHTAEAVQVHGTALLNQAHKAVSDLVCSHVNELCAVLSRQEVVTVLDAARAAVRAAAEAEGQGLAQLSAENSGSRQLIQGEAEVSSQDEVFSSYTVEVDRDWLEHLSGAQLVEHAEMVQAGLQQQQLADTDQSCLHNIGNIITGTIWLVDVALLCNAEAMPYWAVLC